MCVHPMEYISFRPGTIKEKRDYMLINIVSCLLYKATFCLLFIFELVLMQKVYLYS